MIFFILFLMIPVVEIALFISVGDALGLFPTLFLCVLTAVIGAALIRHQGLRTLLSVRKSVAQGDIPLFEFFDGICLAVAGAFLMTPGFFTDTLGFTLLIPSVRIWLRHLLAAHLGIVSSNLKENGLSAHPKNHTTSDTIIDAEYERIDDEKTP